MILRPNQAELLDTTALAQAGPHDVLFTWEQAVRVIRKNRAFALIFALLVTAAVAAAAFWMKDVYQPMARIEVDPPSSGPKTLEIEWNATSENDVDYLETHAQMLQAESLATCVIRILHLERNPEFVGKKAVAQYGQDAREPAGSTVGADHPYLQELFQYADRTPLESIALAAFEKKLSVNTVHASRIIEVSFASHDPQTAKDVVNTLVTQYMDQNYKRRYASTMQASDWLAGQLEGLRRRVEESGRAVTDFQKQYGIVDSEEKDLPLSQLMGEVSRQLSDAQATRIEQEAFVRMIDMGQADSVPALRDDLVYSNVMTKFAEARATLAQARSVYGEENANVKKLREEANELAAQVEAERRRVTDRIRTAFVAARVREEMMLKARDRLRVQLGDTTSHMVQFRMLRNDAQAATNLYDMLKGRLFEAGVYAGLGYTNIHIVDLAPKLPKPTGPHRQLIIAIGGILSGVFALVLAFIRESLNNTVRTPDDVRDWIGLPSLAMVPLIARNGKGGDAAALKNGNGDLSLTASPHPSGLNGQKIWLAEDHTAEGEAMRDLRAALMLTAPGTSRQVVLVASSSASEGKTTVAINLATAFAKRGKTCLLDADLRRPMIANALGLKSDSGLSQVLNGSGSFESAVITAADLPNLALLPAGPLPPNPADLVASEQMRRLVGTLREKYEYVVIDSPPAIRFSDARVLSSLADIVIVVGRYGLTTRRAITRCAQIFEEVRAPLAGVVVNGIDPASPDLHYYNYGFSKEMSSGMKEYYESRAAAARPANSQKEDVKKKGAHA
jgi:polysaccharide biosynthesis transport protein